MCVCVFYAGNTERLTESDFKEKLGIEPATPGLQGIGLSPTPERKLLAALRGINQFRQVGLRFVFWFHDGNT